MRLPRNSMPVLRIKSSNLKPGKTSISQMVMHLSEANFWVHISISLNRWKGKEIRVGWVPGVFNKTTRECYESNVNFN